jgi:hypothetical protein
MALELDMGVFIEVLTLLVEVATTEHAHSFNIDSPIKKHSKRLLDYE